LASGKLDFDSLAAQLLENPIHWLEIWLPGGQAEGLEYKCVNPTRDDKSVGSFSINMQSGKWSDFYTGDSGSDLIALYAYINGISMGDAYKDIKGGNFEKNKPKPRPVGNEGTVAEWEQVIPIPEEAWGSAPREFPKKQKDGSWIRYPFKSRWRYKNKSGASVGDVVRIETPEGKETIPLGLFKPRAGGDTKWKFKSFQRPRPIYQSELFSARPDHPIIIVEGEKCAERLQKIGGSGIIATTWPGGSKAIKLADFSLLADRQVVLWPDNDNPGLRAMVDVGLSIQGKAKRVGFIEVPLAYGEISKIEKGWDVVDCIEKWGWDWEKIKRFIKQNSVALDKIIPGKTVEDEHPPAHTDSDEPLPSALSPVQPPPDEDDSGEDYSQPFKVLGFDHGIYFYLPRGSQQVVPLKTAEHGRAHLMSLAHIRYWESKYPKKVGADWEAAANDLMRACERTGVYESKRIRGCGAWYDSGRIVLNLGDQLRVDGKPMEVSAIDSYNIYEAGPRSEITHCPPMPKQEAVQLSEVCESLFWDKQIFGKLLAGWCVIAPICGALNWRPHIWLTGGAGTGKTFVMNRIIKPMLGPAALHVQSATTEAGIRQTLKNDAWPILFDESEGEDRAGQRRIQVILELMRQASSDTGASILKGTQYGKAMAFQIRSMFCMSSIGVNITQHADQGRISVLSLRIPQEKTPQEIMAHFKKLNEKIASTMTEEFCAGIRARAIDLIPQIRKNGQIFGTAVTELLGAQRIGDQIGALLGGVYALYSDNVISIEAAREWIKSHDWDEQKFTAEHTDERKCLDHILQHVLKLQTSTGPAERNVAEILEEISIFHQPDPQEKQTLDIKDLHRILNRIGLRFDEDNDFIFVSDSHTGIKKMLENTPWPKTWGRVLRRLPGTEMKQSMRFSGAITRATSIPWRMAFPEIQ